MGPSLHRQPVLSSGMRLPPATISPASVNRQDARHDEFSNAQTETVSML